MRPTSYSMMKSNLGMREGDGFMAGWDGDALAGSMEEALERQQEAAEARRSRKDTSLPEDRERKAREESVRLSRARLAEQLVRCKVSYLINALACRSFSGWQEKHNRSN